MHISFEMSGGYGGLFAGQPLSCQIDASKLGDVERRKFLGIVQSSGILDLLPEQCRPAPSRRPDLISYKLHIVQDGEIREFAFDDMNVPAAVRPLLQYLQQQATNMRMKRG